MKSTNKTGLGLGAVFFGLGLLAASGSAEARSDCYYIAHNPYTGQTVADGHASAMKKEWACNRAQRRCNRELERKKRHGLNRGDLAAKCGKAW
jgi:hypothetical protein